MELFSPEWFRFRSGGLEQDGDNDYDKNERADAESDITTHCFSPGFGRSTIGLPGCSAQLGR
jgi:hypothetical protein